METSSVGASLPATYTTEYAPSARQRHDIEPRPANERRNFVDAGEDVLAGATLPPPTERAVRPTKIIKARADLPARSLARRAVRLLESPDLPRPFIDPNRGCDCVQKWDELIRCCLVAYHDEERERSPFLREKELGTRHSRNNHWHRQRIKAPRCYWKRHRPVLGEKRLGSFKLIELNQRYKDAR
jgi:hypothetical protein